MNEGSSKFHWRRYVLLARSFLSTVNQEKNCEAEYRCGISRAYYGAFNETKNYLKSIGETIREKDAGSHTDVIEKCNRYANSGNRLWTGLGDKLKSLKEMRVKADYEEKYFKQYNISENALRNELVQALKLADDIINQIAEIKDKEAQGITFLK